MSDLDKWLDRAYQTGKAGRRIRRLHRWLRETRRQLDDACLLLDEEDPKGASPYMGLSPSSAATQHHPLKEDDHGCRR